MGDTSAASSSAQENHSTAPSHRAVLEGSGPTPEASASAMTAMTAMTAPSRTAIGLTVNGVSHRLDVEDRWTLVELLRDHLDLTGTKIGCDRSECGACTVLMNGKPVYACSQLAVWADEADVRTVEGLVQNGHLSPLQQAFIDHDAFQCGYCTSGQICSAAGLIAEGKARTADEIRELMSGNICRCGAYPNIVAAIQQAMERS